MVSIDDIAAAVAAHREVEIAVLFGSRARDEASASSDVDLAVRGVADRLHIAAELSRSLGTEVDVVDLDTDDLVLLAEIVRDGHCVLERRPGAYAHFRSHAISTVERDLPAIRLQQTAFLSRLSRVGVLGASG